MTRILLVDDHPLIRMGLGAALGREGFVVAADAANGDEAVQKAHEMLPEAVVMDVRLPGMNGIMACAKIIAFRPSTTVVMLSTFEDGFVVEAARRAGARGYFSKELQPRHLAERLRRLVQNTTATDFPSQQHFDLTNRERSVLRELIRGSTTGEVATALGIGRETVKDYIARLYEKFGVTDRTSLARIFGPVGQELIDLDY